MIHTKNVDPYVAAFPYAPSAEKAPNSQGITVAIAKPSFFAAKVPEGDETWAHQIRILNKVDPSTGEMLWFAFPQFQNLTIKFRKDVAEIVFAKGFKVRGPYESWETIPAADRSAIDLYFIPKMKLVFTQQAKKWKRGDETMDTDIAVDGTITIEALSHIAQTSARSDPRSRFAAAASFAAGYSLFSSCSISASS